MRATAKTITRSLVALTVMMTMYASALAHVAEGGADGFLTGFNHPLSGWDHILAMVAVGLWGAQLGPPAIWLLPITFPLMMAIGGFLGLIGVPLPGVEIGIALSAVVLGVSIARQARPPLWMCMAIVAVFALFHGHAHGTELQPGADALAYSLGFVIATGLLHAVGITIGVLRRWKVGEWGVQGMGAGVSIAGLVLLMEAVNW
ncbi:urease accessory protein [Rhizobiales bacterium GAS113]|nr:urease accessory protein [Rhizobiales bacterium GAS113]